MQPGINTFTGGTATNPTVNITGGTFSNLTVTGTTILTGMTNVFGATLNIFQTGALFNTSTSPHIANYALTSGLYFDDNTVKVLGGFSANTFSASTINSGQTNLYQIFSPLGHTHQFSTILNTAHTHSISDVINLQSTLDAKLDLTGVTNTFVQPGLNTFTGGTSTRPTINISALTIDNVIATGSTNSRFNVLSATTIYSPLITGATISATTVNANRELVFPSQGYYLSARTAGSMGFVASTPNQSSQMEWYTKNGDGTNYNALNVFAVGTIGNISTRARLILGYDITLGGRWTIQQEGILTKAYPISIGRQGLQDLFMATGGTIGIRNSLPTAYLHITGGTASANNAPLKFTQGINLTSPEPGAVEYNGLRLFITNSASTRQTIAYTSEQVISSGFSQVAAAVTTFTVPIGQTLSSTNYRVNVTSTSVLAAASWYVNNKTTTTFDVVFLTALTGTVTFDWMLCQT